MRVRWHLLQYTPDPQRHETRNVGIVVTDGVKVAARFLGEDSRGDLDLRRVPRWIDSRPAYRTWVAHWREAITEVPPEELTHALIPTTRPGKYVLLPPRGPLKEVPDQDLRGLTRQLFDQLVGEEDEESTDAPDLVTLCDRALQPLQRQPSLRFHRDPRVPAPLGDGHQQPLQFHYGIQNGKWHYMRRLNLGSTSASTWDRVAATLFQFDRLHRLPSFANANRITLTSLQDAIGGGLEDQLAALYKECEVVDVSDVGQARATLQDMIQTN